jgi:acetoin utilization deacetylase AcuC-like enzyme
LRGACALGPCDGCVQRPHLATAEEMKEFHSSDYVDFLRRITPENMHEYASQMQKFGIGEGSDCPTFDGLYDYCRIHAGASVGELGQRVRARGRDWCCCR